MKDYFGFKDTVFRNSLFRLAIPIMLQQLMSASISMLGNMMVGGLGDNALAALLQATQISFLMMVFMFGISSTTQAFASQYWGQKDIASIRKTLGFSLVCGQVIGWGFFAVSFLAPDAILSLYTKDAAVHALGVEYLRIACFSYPIIGFTSAYAATLRGTENVKLPMATSVIGLLLNGILNYLLIYGNLGFPKMGISGAAVAVVAAQLTDMTLLLLLSRLLKMPTAKSEYPLLRFDKAFVKRFGVIAVPIFLNESLWALAQATIVLIYSWLGTQMAAAMGVFGTFERLGFVAFMGIGNACGVLCGKCIGAKDEENAQLYAMRILRLAPLFGLIAGLAANLLMPVVLSFYVLSDAARAILTNNVRLYILLAPVMAVSYTIVVGALRCGGDARYSLLLDAGLQWALIVTGVAAAAFVLHVPLIWVYAFTAPGELVKLVMGVRRIKSRLWMHNLT